MNIKLKIASLFWWTIVFMFLQIIMIHCFLYVSWLGVRLLLCTWAELTTINCRWKKIHYKHMC